MGEKNFKSISKPGNFLSFLHFFSFILLSIETLIFQVFSIEKQYEGDGNMGKQIRNEISNKLDNIYSENHRSTGDSSGFSIIIF